MTQKEQLRKQFALIRKGIENRVEKENALSDKLFDKLKGCKSVFCYVSFGSEMSTHSFIEKMLSSAAAVGVPHTHSGFMKCRKLISYESLFADKAGNLTQAVLGDEFEPDAVVVPMLSFNKDCFRLGYGGGYYDKYLKGKQILSVGIAFDEQFCPEFAPEPFDVKLGVILTPLNTYGSAK